VLEILYIKEIDVIRAYGGNIIAKRVGLDNKNSAGVVKTSSNKEKPLEIVVIDSNVVDILPGDRFLIARYSGTEIEHDGTDYIVVTKDDIIARVQND